MKKLLTLVLVLTMTLTLDLSVFAGPGGFVASPSGNDGPTVEEEDPSDGCSAKIVVTPYVKRDTLPTDARALIEKAYWEIVGAPDIGELNKDLKTLAEQLKITTDALAVSDLFDVRFTGCDDHREHGPIAVKLKAETLKNFVALMHFNGETWELIDAKIEGENADILAFDFQKVGPYAIVVDVTGNVQPPQSGDMLAVLLIALIAVSATGLIIIGIRNRKEEEKA